MVPGVLQGVLENKISFKKDPMTLMETELLYSNMTKTFNYINDRG